MVSTDDDTDEAPLYETTPNWRMEWIPSYPRCPGGCDEEGSVPGVGHVREVHRATGVTSEFMSERLDCPVCDGMGYLGVPTSREEAAAARERNPADLVLIRKARYAAGMGIF